MTRYTLRETKGRLSKMTLRFLALANERKVALFVQTENNLEGKFKSSVLEMGISDVRDVQV